VDTERSRSINVVYFELWAVWFVWQELQLKFSDENKKMYF